MDRTEAARRGRNIIREPSEILRSVGVEPDTIDDVIITHLHYDHAGSLDSFPNARFHVQSAEMAYVTGPCMCSPILQTPFTMQHVCRMVEHVYSGRVVFHEENGRIASGVTVHRTGGHTRGLQAVRVETVGGPLVLASDASHYYENFETSRPFPIVVDVADAVAAFSLLRRLAGGDDTAIIPGHDPLVAQRYPILNRDADVLRLDRGRKAAPKE